jgi:hypothetical protein
MFVCTVHIGNGNFHKHFVFQNSARGTGPRRVFIRNGKYCTHLGIIVVFLLYVLPMRFIFGLVV